MTTIRVEKRRNYVSIQNEVLCDKRLSWKARGLLAYLLSKPNDWKIRIPDLINNGPDGKDAVYSTLTELGSFGYLEKQATKGENGRFAGVSYVIHEEPIDPAASGFSVHGETASGFSVSGPTASGQSASTNTKRDKRLREEKTDETTVAKIHEKPQGNVTTPSTKGATHPAPFLGTVLQAVVTSYPKHRVPLHDQEGIVDAWNAIVAVEPGTAGVIANDIAQRKASDDWQKDGGRWIPNLIKYLKSRGWEMPVVIAPPPPGHLHPKEGQATMIWGVDY